MLEDKRVCFSWREMGLSDDAWCKVKAYDAEGAARSAAEDLDSDYGLISSGRMAKIEVRTATGHVTRWDVFARASVDYHVSRIAEAGAGDGR